MDLTCQQSLFITRFFLKKPSQPEINTPLKNLKKNEEESTTNIFLWSYFYIHHEAKKTGQCSFFSFTFEITMFFFVGGEKKNQKPSWCKVATRNAGSYMLIPAKHIFLFLSLFTTTNASVWAHDIDFQHHKKPTFTSLGQLASIEKRKSISWCNSPLIIYYTYGVARQLLSF